MTFVGSWQRESRLKIFERFSSRKAGCGMEKVRTTGCY